MDALPDYATLTRMTDKELSDLFGVRDFFIYEIDFSALAAAGTATGSFNVQSDSNFLWQYGCMSADIGGAAQLDGTRVIPLVSATLQDQSSGRQLMTSNVPVSAFFGYGSLPFLLPTPRFFRAQTTVTLSLLNYSTGSTYNLKFSFIGTKFFKFAQSI